MTKPLKTIAGGPTSVPMTAAKTLRHQRGAPNAALMEWMPPPDGIAMCQGGDACRIPRNGEGIHERS